MLNGEKFLKEIKDVDYVFALKENKILKCGSFEGCSGCAFQGSCWLNRTKWLLKEYKEPILTDKDKIIIKDIIKAFEPFGKKLKYITKYSWNIETKGYYLNFEYKGDDFDTFNFSGDEFFVGMELDKAYTPEELGL